uniref:Uncharacterized protein n=1 Tax=Setaria digitata TaxID=48799 RepID=A0A915PJ38_9BILA
MGSGGKKEKELKDASLKLEQLGVAPSGIPRNISVEINT